MLSACYTQRWNTVQCDSLLLPYTLHMLRKTLTHTGIYDIHGSIDIWDFSGCMLPVLSKLPEWFDVCCNHCCVLCSMHSVNCLCVILHQTLTDMAKLSCIQSHSNHTEVAASLCVLPVQKQSTYQFYHPDVVAETVCF